MAISKKVVLTVLKAMFPIAVMLLIFLFSAEISDESSSRSMPLAELLHLPEWFIRKSAHFFIYALLGASWFNLFRATKLPRSTKIWLPTLLVAVYATADEIHQVFVPGRAGLVADVLLDTVAGFLAIIAFSIIISRFRKKMI